MSAHGHGTARAVRLEPTGGLLRPLPNLLIPFLPGASSEHVPDSEGTQLRQHHAPSLRRRAALVAALAADRATIVAPAVRLESAALPSGLRTRSQELSRRKK